MRRQSGVAALTAILIVAVAASAAAMMLSQHSAMLDQTLLVSARAQADQYATAGLDWARGVLTQDARSSSVDSLNEGWAQPIVGMPIERAVVAGAIADEQGKFNLNNLVPHNRNVKAVKAFQRLLVLLDLPPELADTAADYIDSNASDSYYLGLPRPYRAAKINKYATVDELYRVRGFDARAVEKLRPYVTAIPEDAASKVNGNTASDLVLAALYDTDREKVADIIAERRAKPFDTTHALVDRLRQAGLTTPNDVDVKSDWFTVRVTVQQDDVRLGTEALVHRQPLEKGGATTIVWRRPRY
jgi:general secretion pathway protein K